MTNRYEVYAWNPAFDDATAHISTDDYNYASEALTDICCANKGWVGFIFDNWQNRRTAAIGVTLD